MFGSYLYRLSIYRFGFLFGHILFGLGYAYLSGVVLQIILSSGDQLTMNPVWVWKNLINHWNHWSVYKDRLEMKVWFALFGAAIIPLFLFAITERILHWTLMFIFWPLRVWRRKQEAKKPHIMTPQEHMESIESKLDALRKDLDALHHKTPESDGGKQP